jgi:hypothetical protein
MSILIGSDERNHVQLSVSGWAIDEPENPIDAAWLAAEIGVAAGPLNGRFPTQLRREDLVTWRNELAALDNEFRPGEASFSASLEPSIGLAVTISNTGRLSVEGWIEPSLGELAEQRLEFRFPTDQSLREVLAQLDSLLRRFPDRTSGLDGKLG